MTTMPQTITLDYDEYMAKLSEMLLRGIQVGRAEVEREQNMPRLYAVDQSTAEVLHLFPTNGSSAA